MADLFLEASSLCHERWAGVKEVILFSTRELVPPNLLRQLF